MKGFPDDSVEKISPANAGDAGDYGSIPGSGRSPEEGIATTPVFLPGKSRGQRSLAGYSPRGRIESDPTEHTHTWGTLLRLDDFLKVPQEFVCLFFF